MLRRELAQGRVPPRQVVYCGGPYNIRMELAGPQAVTVSRKNVEAARVVVSIKGPASDIAVEVFFSRDAARTPLLARAPFALGTFSMELVR